MYFQIVWQNCCRKTIEATTAKKVPNERKLIYAIYTFIVASWCLLFSYCSRLNTTTNLNGILATLTLASMGIVKSYVKMYVPFKRDLLENQNYNLF